MSVDKAKDITLEAAEPIKAVFSFGADVQVRLPMVAKESKNGNVYWTVPGSKGRYGTKVTVPAVAINKDGSVKLPDRVQLETTNKVTVGQEFLTLEAGTTTSGNRKVSGSKMVTVPTTDDVKRNLQVTISDIGGGRYNVILSAITPGGGSQEAVDLFE